MTTINRQVGEEVCIFGTLAIARILEFANGEKVLQIHDGRGGEPIAISFEVLQTILKWAEGK